MTKEELKDFTINFYSTHHKETEQIKTLLDIKLTQICLAYTSAHHLPVEALTVTTRIKTLDSFLKKLERKGWPEFDNPAAVINDFIGARITCWFLDDCTNVLNSIRQNGEIIIIDDSIENYILKPKPSGYRALHVLANFNYNNLAHKEHPGHKTICEIQIRTRLQDTWGDITHELYYRAKYSRQSDKLNDNFLLDISDRFLQEDKALLTIKKIYASREKD